jgi:hypothetical protein
LALNPNPTPSAQLGLIDRLFAVLASPWALASGLAMGAMVHLVEASALMGAGTHATTTWSVRALAVGVVVVSAVAMAIARALPALRSASNAGSDGVLADLVLPAELLDPGALQLGDRRSSMYRGATAVAGAVLVLLAALGYLALPLVASTGLAQGGELALVAGQPAESARVFREGIWVRENLGGAGYVLADVTTSGTPTVTLDITQVQTGTLDRVVLEAGAAVQHGSHVLRVRGIEPSLRPAGVTVDITDSQENRSFALRLTPGRPTQDPAGPGVFALQRVAPNWAGGAGFGASGTVQEVEDGPAASFLAFEERPDFDELHRSGRYHIRFKAPIDGNRVTIAIHEPSGDDRLPVLLVLLALGVALLASSRHVAAVLIPGTRGDSIAVGSLNEGASVIRTVAALIHEEDA